MNRLFDVMLGGPLPQEWIRGLLFATFSFHILLVLMTIGTAILAFSHFARASLSGKRDEVQADDTVSRSFLAIKSLAVVLGLAPLLLIQIGFPVPFFNSVGIFAPYWLYVIVLLIVSFLSFDALGHKTYVHRHLRFLLGVIALVFLLIVPAIFVLILVTAENPGQWVGIIRNGYHIKGPLAVHWFLRYLHVIGAAVVFGAAFHYFFAARDDEKKRLSLSRWIMAGILFQFGEGPLLALSVPHKADYIVAAFLITGIAAAAYIVWRIFSTVTAVSVLKFRLTVPLLLITLVSMLLIRQHFQDMTFLPLSKDVTESGNIYRGQLHPYRAEAVGEYMNDIKLVYDNGSTIYSGSCSFCHGSDADGKGPEAGNLSIPPEDVAAIRADRQYLYERIAEGVPGTSMPYFTIFDRGKLDKLINYLDGRFHVVGLPEALPVTVSESAMTKAAAIYKDTCSVCHGMDGRGSVSSKNFRPPPPDFTRYSLSPSRAFAVIRDRYPGTAMPPFGSLPEDVRWGLVKILYEKRG